MSLPLGVGLLGDYSIASHPLGGGSLGCCFLDIRACFQLHLDNVIIVLLWPLIIAS